MVVPCDILRAVVSLIAADIANQEAVFLFDMRVVVLLVGAAARILQVTLSNKRLQVAVDELRAVVRVNGPDRIRPLVKDTTECIQDTGLSAPKHGQTSTVASDDIHDR